VTASGLLVIDKPGGMTSHDVVARVRRIMGTRKVGHAGTLDPMATGVLVVGVEKATRLLGHLSLHDKAYAATMRLGATTVTDDAEGEVLAVAAAQELARVDAPAIGTGIARLRGAIEQRPSSISAVKVDGRRSYDRVRAGEEVDLPTRSVVVTRFDVLGMRRDDGFVDIDVEVECSTGTYVRALARDLGADLGVGGHLTRLRRTRLGHFGQDSALGLDALAEAGEAAIIGLPAAAARCFPTWRLEEGQARAVAFGQRIPWGGPRDAVGPVALLAPSGELLALAVADAEVARYLAVFA
jgi:tRNA pseudouridine55 synthase